VPALPTITSGNVDLFDEEAMDNFPVLVAVSAAILLGAMSPGPSFVVVARTAISSSRGHGVLAALGMGIGGATFAVAALLGLHVLLAAAPPLHMALQIVGAGYLLLIAYKLWKAAPEPFNMNGDKLHREKSSVHAFVLGLGTQLSNPKTALVYASIFSAALPKGSSSVAAATLVLIIFAIEFGWYTLVATAFSTGGARRTYGHWKACIDRLAAGAMGALGVKILVDVRPN
jgi:threonine/homoserine/homoserine lactone efflux protein